MTLVVGYVSLNQLGIVFIIEGLEGQIGYALNLLCRKSSHVIQIVEKCPVDIPILYAMSPSRRPNLNRTRTKKNSYSADRFLFGPFFT